MALRTTLRTATGAPRRPAAPVEVTIEEARTLYPVGSLELVIAELKESDRLDAIAKEHGNAKNRQDTKAAGAVRSYALATGLQPADELQIGESGYRYDVTHSEKVSVEGLYKMHKDGKITDGEFLRSITVNKADAEKAIGPHKLLSITTVTDGKKLDIRKRKLDAAVEKPTIVKSNHRVEPKLNNTQQEAPVRKTATTKSTIKPLRVLKLRGK